MRNLIGLLVLGLLGLSSTLVHAATLESPAPGANVSGLGYIGGWKCHHGEVTVRIDGGGPIRMATRMPRADTQPVCQGATDNGFITQFNWAFLTDGSHTIVAYDNGVEFARSTFTVATFGEEFVTGAEGECTITDFPSPGETAHFVWNESTQHLELVDGEEVLLFADDFSSGNLSKWTQAEKSSVGGSPSPGRLSVVNGVLVMEATAGGNYDVRVIKELAPQSRHGSYRLSFDWKAVTRETPYGLDGVRLRFYDAGDRLIGELVAVNSGQTRRGGNVLDHVCPSHLSEDQCAGIGKLAETFDWESVTLDTTMIPGMDPGNVARLELRAWVYNDAGSGGEMHFDNFELAGSASSTTTPPPTFGGQSIPDQQYTQDTAISTLTLPAATGGTGTLTYSLSPALPAGLRFDARTRRLSGTPTSTLASTRYTYTVTDANGATDALTFRLRVAGGEPGLAPADQAAWIRLVAGKRVVNVNDSADYYEFSSTGRFTYHFHGSQVSGTYSYRKTGPNTADVTVNSDAGVSCTYRGTFTSATTGTAVEDCSGDRIDWQIIP